jgi:hypothetical protein
MKQFLKSTAVIGSLCFLVCSCTDEKVKSTEYGEFSHRITDYETKGFLWFDNDSRKSEYSLYYHGNKINFSEKAPGFLNAEKGSEIIPLDVAEPFYGSNLGTYCLLSNGTKSSLVVLKPQGATFDIIPLVNISTDTTALCRLSDLSPIGSNKVLYANYVIDEKESKVLAQFVPVSRYYKTMEGDTSNLDGWANTYYGISPDNNIIVRSFYPFMMDAHPELKSLFLSNLKTGKTTEFPLIDGEMELVDTYNNKKEDKKPYQWFKEMFEWEEVKGNYRLKIKSKVLTPEKSTIK